MTNREEEDLRDLLRELRTGLLNALRERDTAYERIITLEEEQRDHTRVFELQHKRMSEATIAWREAHPGNDSTFPDLGKLLTWLLSQRKDPAP